MAYAERILNVAIGRTGDWLERKFHPRLATTIAIFLGCVIAWLAGFVFDGIGLSSLVVRLPLGFLLGFSVYTAVIGVWAHSRTEVGTKRVMVGATEHIHTIGPSAVNPDAARHGGNYGPGQTSFGEAMSEGFEITVAEEGLGAVAGWLLAGFFLGGFFVFAHRIFYAPWYLGEFLLLSGKVRHPSKSIPEPKPWLNVLLSQSKIAVPILLVHYLLLGWVLTLMAPDAHSLGDVFSAMAEQHG